MFNFSSNKYFFLGATTLLLHYLTLFSKCRNLPGSAAAAEHYVVYQMLLSNSDEAICGACSRYWPFNLTGIFLMFPLPLYPSTPLAAASLQCMFRYQKTWHIEVGARLER
jgi:hypothetical protein